MMEKVNQTDLSVDMTFNLFRFKVVCVGDASVGKTSIINQIMENKFKEEYEASVGVDFFSKTIRFKDKNLKLQIWDSAGQEKYRSLIPNYIRGSSIVFLIFDIANKSTFDSLSSWIQFIHDNDKPKIILCGNKIDLGAESRTVSEAEAKEFSEKNNLKYFEVSAKTGEGIKHLLYSSVALLPFFEQFEEDEAKIVEELMTDNMIDNNASSNRSNLSILEQSKGNIKIARDDKLFDTETPKDTAEGEKEVNLKKSGKEKSTKCQC